MISLSEVMTQEELEKLLLLTCSTDCNHGNVSWGGSWAGHAITCLLLDLLDGEIGICVITNLRKFKFNYR